MQRTYQKLYWVFLTFGVLLITLGVAWDFHGIFSGLYKIVATQDMLITDYVEIVGMGASLVNVGIVTIITVGLLYLAKEPFNGMTIVTTMIMAGFSLFGKNFVNIWPIIFGSWLYAKYKKEHFSKYVSVSLLATALSPLVSYMAIGSNIASIPVGILAGVIVGFVLPPISGYTYKIQNGINLYNVGFACGMFALMIVPVLTAFGDNPPKAMHWNTTHTSEFLAILLAMCVLLIISAFFLCGKTPKQVVKSYLALMKKSGRSPSDFLRMFGLAPILLNMGLVGIIGTAYIMIIGGDLNGPTVGGIFTIMGFGAFGKHPRNMLPVMLGVFLGAYGMHLEPNNPSLQLACLFGTTLAPITGQFGIFAGIAVGFIHASLVLQTSGSVAGMNLYNNGFSGGLIAIVMYPLLTEIFKKKRIKMQDKDYFELFEEDTPIDPNRHKKPSEVDVIMNKELKQLKKIKHDMEHPNEHGIFHMPRFMHYDHPQNEDYTHKINDIKHNGEEEHEEN